MESGKRTIKGGYQRIGSRTLNISGEGIGEEQEKLKIKGRSLSAPCGSRVKIKTTPPLINKN